MFYKFSKHWKPVTVDEVSNFLSVLDDSGIKNEYEKLMNE